MSAPKPDAPPPSTGGCAADGLFVAVVGPSGAGKDSLINGLRARLGEADGVFYARRVVTRRADAFEDHDTLAENEFLRAREEGRFALTWPAHGLLYGVPNEVDARITNGVVVVCNVSRAAAAEVRRRYRRSLVVLITASPETLAARLASRGRESAEGRRSRLDRSASPEVVLEADATIDNDGSLEEAIDRLRDLVVAHRAARRT